MKNIILLLVWPYFSSSMVGVYTGHNQVCTAVNLFDCKWTLTLNKDSTFAFQRNYYNSTLTNRFYSNEDRGTWYVSKDTLKLHFFGIHDKAFIIKKKELTPVEREIEFVGDYSLALYHLKKE